MLCSLGTWGWCTLHTHPLLRYWKGRKGLEGSPLSWKGVQWTGQPAEAQSSDVIGKCSNQGSRRVSALHHSPQETLPQLVVVLGS